MADTIRMKWEKPRSIKQTEPSPCSVECPLGTNVKAYVSLVAARRFDEALEEVRRTNPFPGICGRVCPHSCEDQCLRGDIDEPIAIAALKRFIADYELRRGVMPRLERLNQKQGKIAVIGSGPAGLTCAADLAREGYGVQVFEALSLPGGMMAVGIPPYRLPRDILRAEIAAIEALGVAIKLNVRVDGRPSLDDLVRKFDAVFIATGAQKPRALGIPGETDVQYGLVNWIPLLREVALGRGQKPGGRVVIVGGGNTAVDCARVALRLGSESVQILYRRSREEMPAYKEEIAGAEEEGITISFLTVPVRLSAEKGRLIGVECLRTRLGSRDGSGRRRPIPIQNSQFMIRCDAIIPTIGQELDPSFLRETHNLRISKEHLLVVDRLTMATNRKGVFAGGDAVTGPASVVEAIAAGHLAARSIDRYVNGLPLKSPPKGAPPRLGELTLEIPPPPKRRRIEDARMPAEERRDSFDEIDHGLTEAQAVTEAERCMRCGLCLECATCVEVCDGRQVVVEPAGLRATQMLRKPEILLRVRPEVHQRIAAQGVASLQYRDRQYEASVFTARINEHLCRGCGLCEEICGYRAVQVLYRGNGVFTARVDEDTCRGCGTCVAVCPSGAIDQNYFTSQRITHLIAATLQRHRRRPRLVIFACRWSAPLKTGPSRMPSETVRVMCTGRLVGGDILKAFETGAAGVLIIGCANDDCHYGFGSLVAKENLQRVSHILSLLGFERKRLRLSTIPADSEAELADMVRDFLEDIEKQGPSPIGVTKC